MPQQNIQLADELTGDQLIELAGKLEEIQTEAEALQLTKVSKPAWEVRLELDYLRLSVLEAMAILDGNPR